MENVNKDDLDFLLHDLFYANLDKDRIESKGFKKKGKPTKMLKSRNVINKTKLVSSMLIQSFSYGIYMTGILLNTEIHELGHYLWSFFANIANKSDYVSDMHFKKMDTLLLQNIRETFQTGDPARLLQTQLKIDPEIMIDKTRSYTPETMGYVFNDVDANISDSLYDKYNSGQISTEVFNYEFNRAHVNQDLMSVITLLGGPVTGILYSAFLLGVARRMDDWKYPFLKPFIALDAMLSPMFNIYWNRSDLYQVADFSKDMIVRGGTGDVWSDGLSHLLSDGNMNMIMFGIPNFTIALLAAKTFGNCVFYTEYSSLPFALKYGIGPKMSNKIFKKMWKEDKKFLRNYLKESEYEPDNKEILYGLANLKRPLTYAAENILNHCYWYPRAEKINLFVKYEDLSKDDQLYIDNVSKYFENRFGNEDSKKVATYLVRLMPSTIPIKDLLKDVVKSDVR